MTDEKIISLLFARDETAIEEIRNKYGRFLISISKSILSSEEDAKECENDALLAVWNTIPPQKPTYLKGYLASLIRHISFDKYDRAHAKKREGGEYAAAVEELSEVLSDDAPDPADRLALKEAINGFLARLPARERIVFVMRYWYMTPVSEIARRRGMKESAVKMTLLRLRQQLAAHLSQNGIDV